MSSGRPPSAAASSSVRIETDSLGPVEVPGDVYWGAQTQRSVENFPIGRDRFVWGRSMIEALGLVKRTAAAANRELGEIDDDVAGWIIAAADEVVAGDLDHHFPVVVWQTGSGTQSNMNANEVIANRAIELAGGVIGSKEPVHPNDHVNRGQSSNDVFPTAMHVAIVLDVRRRLLPALDGLRSTLVGAAQATADVVMVGRTHLQDAAPVTLGQVIGGWVGQIDDARAGVVATESGLARLAIGGTAVGTGLNAHPEFGARVAAGLAGSTGVDFSASENPFTALSAHDAVVAASAALRTLAGALLKIANDVRWYASGPRSGIGELTIPANEPGSSIMPGKVNPTQAEALTMVSARVFGNDATVAFAGSQGNFQLNVYKPVMAHGVLESVDLLADAITSFDERCARGLEPVGPRIADNLARNAMVVTALNPHIGYDAAGEIAKRAVAEGTTVREAAIASGHVTGAQFDAWVDPLAMTNPDRWPAP